MTKVIDAIYSNGAFRPTHGFSMRELQRVRLIVQEVETPSNAERELALAELRAGIAKMTFKSDGPYPTRDELHERP